MFDLRLTPEQIEFRDTVRDFVRNEVHPAAIHSDRLQPFEKPLLDDLLDDASRMGLRTLALSEAAGGAGADTMTSCIVLEELAAGDVDIAVVLGLTSRLGAALFDECLSPEQRAKHLPAFLDERRAHVALVAHDYTTERAWQYHRDYEEAGGEPVAVRQDNGDWALDGEVAFVANAPIATLFVVQARTDPKKTGTNGLTTFLVPRDTAGFTVGEAPRATGSSNAEGAELARWHHGAGAGVRFKACRVPAANIVGGEGRTPLSSAKNLARASIETAAINLGVGRAAYDAAVDYAKIRVQGGRPIIQHHAIGRILADCATRLELARSLIWKAAWVLDNPDAVGDSVADLPLHVMARTYTAEAMHDVALEAAECFGAMGVMRDMPLQKYVHDAMVLMHAADHDSATKLQIAESIAGFERPAAA